ncbi:MAG: YicC family protein [Deltaproteobacteria bacterium]|nr:YicC family protein [Deltaproteobacteria bacterium]
MRSMTAYGRGEYKQNDTVFIAELKSVNNRYRDIMLRTPRTLQPLEEDIRSRISSRIGRGRIEVFIQVEEKGEESEYALELNLPLVRSYMGILKQMRDEFGLNEKIDSDSLLQMKDVIIIKPEHVDMEKSRTGVMEALSQALDSLDAMRDQEGKTIEEDFLKRLGLIEKYLDDIEKKAPLVVEEYRKKLRDRIDSISADMEIDENRLAQETAIFAGRCDITEEIVRTRSHLEQFRNYLSNQGSLGRRLDFLLQELNRETNTISAKASDSSISANAVEIKAELEKIREQVQNIE